MKNRMLHLLIVAGFALAFALGMSSFVAQATSAALAVPQQRHEAFQDLKQAQSLLTNARAVLASAPGSYGGHRENAMKRVDEALAEVNKAFEYKEHH